MSFGADAQTGEDDELDSLIYLYHNLDDEDTSKAGICENIAILHYSVDSTLLWADRLYEQAVNSVNSYYEGRAYYFKSWAYNNMSVWDSAIYFGNKALLIADSLKINKFKVLCFLQLASPYSSCFIFDDSDDCLIQAMDIARSDKDTALLCEALRQLGSNYVIRRMYQKAEQTFNEVLSLDSLFSPQDSRLILFELSDVYSNMYSEQLPSNDFSLVLKAKEYALRAYSMETVYYLDDFYVLKSLLKSMFYEGINSSGIRKKQIVDSMKVFIDEAFQLIDELGLDSETNTLMMNVANYEILAGNLARAKFVLDSLQSLDSLYNYDISYYHYYMARNIKDSAYYHLLLALKYKLDDYSVDKAVNISGVIQENDFKEQIRNREIEEQKRSERRTRIIIYVAIGIFLILAFIIFEYFRKRKHNRILNEKNIILLNQKEEILQQKEELNASKDELFARNEEIMAQNQQIVNKNKQITDSINYASLIQKAALPRPEDLSALFGKYFLIYRPLNIVAGDFYWASQVGRFSILVCADCTGHGVPGAFVSMLGVSLLNEVTANISADTKASDILNELRAKLMRALGQNKKKYDNGAVYSMDGMDLAMVMIDYDNMQMQFAGAYRPLWIWRSGELIQYKPDKMPIGIYLGPEKDFTNHEIEILPGDVLYMFSDGIPDQFGFIDDSHTTCKHFSTKRLAALLTEIGGHQLQEQKSRIESEVDAWKNGYKQLDDNILIGIRI